jgi:hypothetical protein
MAAFAVIGGVPNEKACRPYRATKGKVERPYPAREDGAENGQALDYQNPRWLRLLVPALA